MIRQQHRRELIKRDESLLNRAMYYYIDSKAHAIGRVRRGRRYWVAMQNRVARSRTSPISSEECVGNTFASARRIEWCLKHFPIRIPIRIAVGRVWQDRGGGETKKVKFRSKKFDIWVGFYLFFWLNTQPKLFVQGWRVHKDIVKVQANKRE